MSQGIGKGRGGAQDLNPGLLTPEHHAGCQVLSVGAGEQLEPLRAASNSRGSHQDLGWIGVSEIVVLSVSSEGHQGA